MAGAAPSKDLTPDQQSKDVLRREALEYVRSCLSARENTPNGVLSLMGAMRPDSPIESWDRLYFELVNIGQRKLAEQIAAICRGARLDLWRAVKSDSDMMAQIFPICDQLDRARDAAEARLHARLAALFRATRGSFVPGREMRASIVNMARFGSPVDDHAIRVIVEELYIQRRRYRPVLDICADILKFRGYDRHRMMSSTLVEDMVGAVLAKMQSPHDRDPAGGEDDLSPLRPASGDPLRHDRLLAECMKILRRRAGMLGLGAPPPDGGDTPLRASALALGISKRRQDYGTDELIRHVELHHPRSHRFLQLGRPAALRGLARPGSPLAQEISAAVSRGTAGAQNAPGNRHGALGLLEALLANTDLAGDAPGPLAAKRWRDGMRGSRLWGCLLEMEMYLRLRASGADVAVVSGRGGKEAALELTGCRAEIHSALDGRDAQAGDPGLKMARRILGRARQGSLQDPRTAVIVECPAPLFPDLVELGRGIAPLLAPGKQPGAMFLVSRALGRFTHVLLQNPDPGVRAPGPAIGLVERALQLDIAKFANFVYLGAIGENAVGP